MSKIIEQARKLRPIIEQASASLDDKTASNSIELLPKMKYNGELIRSGTRINFNGALKRAAVDLWDTEANNPDNTPDIWEDILYKEGYRIIPEVITAGLAFAMDECGWWNGSLYKSKNASNVYTPDQYADGWEKVR